ncbi:MAG: hypothetical protein LBD67_11085 [Candidatus Accumulibacter sp.]|jgi:hypothetical protein|nr:hypothetical protein [Accumulibacter sp.]
MSGTSSFQDLNVAVVPYPALGDAAVTLSGLDIPASRRAGELFLQPVPIRIRLFPLAESAAR